MNTRDTALVGALVVMGVLLIAVVFLVARKPAAAAGPPATNAWDALIGLGKNAADAYGYA